MALGGGVFTTQNKVLPGAYINFISASRAAATLSERGYAALALELDWGKDGEIFAVSAEEFQKNSLKIFGYDYKHDKLKGLRDLFRNITTAYLYRLNSGGVKAQNALAKALFAGILGNDLKIVVQESTLSTEENPLFEVITHLDNVKVDTQTVSTAAELVSNDYVEFISTATLEPTAGMPLAGGTNGTITNTAYQDFLDKAESFSFNAIGCLSDDETIKGLFAAFTRRMRDEVGVKFQCVLHRYNSPDYEGVVSVENNTDTSLIYWVLGAIAGCEVNRSNTNKIYDGEFEVDTKYTQNQLVEGLMQGKFMLHKVGDSVRVLEDINTAVTITDERSADFKYNQTIRVLDQIGNDIAKLFADKYLGVIPNDNAGRISLWNDIVKHHQALETIRAIENFNPDSLKVEKGESKKAVVVTDYVTPVNAMAQLYMTVMVE